jgi:TetR/AcrR family transcriptional repressor of nem operon
MLNTELHTRDKIVELGRNYIQRVGYHSFNYKQIATTLNIKNSAIHHYYPGKEDLGVAVVKKDHEDFKKMKDGLALHSPLQNVEALLNNYADYFKEGKLCVIGTFESVAYEIPEKIKLSTVAYLGDLFSWLKDAMQAGLDKGDFHFKQSPAELAELWLATLPGALMTGRLRGEITFNILMQQLKNSLAAK